MPFKPVSDYIESFFRTEKGVPACQIRIMREHETLLKYSSGKDLCDDSLYFLYSCTKPITVTAGMQLVEKGVVSLDDPVGRYLPRFNDVFLLIDGRKVSPSKKMTLRHLFTMSGGLDYNFRAAPVKALVEKKPAASTLEVVDAFASSPLLFEPGERFKYSLCHDVLAAVIEVASKERFGSYLKKHIFDPLGMKKIGFVVPESEKENLVALYTYENGKILPRESICEFRLSENYESGGAGLYATLEDYSLFADAMSCGGIGLTGKRILRAETIDEMRKEQLSSFAVDTEFSCAAGAGYGYGLGVRTLIDKSLGQRSALGEFGWDGAAGSYILMDPQNKLSITFTMHVRNWPALIGHAHSNIRDMTYDILGI